MDRCIVGDVRKLSKIMDSYIEKCIKASGLPIRLNHIPLFYIITASDEPISFNEIMHQWGISKSSLSDIINKYEQMGFLTKCSCASDKRSVLIIANEKIFEIKSLLDSFEDDLLNELFSDDSIDIKSYENLTSKLLAKGQSL